MEIPKYKILYVSKNFINFIRFLIQMKVSEQKQRIEQIEEKFKTMEDVRSDVPDVAILKTALREAKLEIKILKGKLDMFSTKGTLKSYNIFH